MFHNSKAFVAVTVLLVLFAGSAYSFGITAPLAQPLGISAHDTRFRSGFAALSAGRSLLKGPYLSPLGNSPVSPFAWANFPSINVHRKQTLRTGAVQLSAVGGQPQQRPSGLRAQPFDLNAEPSALSPNRALPRVRSSSLSQNVWVGKRGDDEVAADLKRKAATLFSSQEQKTLRKLREKMSLTRRKSTNAKASPKAPTTGDEQTIMERERLREKLALRKSGGTRAVSHIAKTNNNFKGPKAQLKGPSKSADSSRQVRAAYNNRVSDHPEMRESSPSRSSGEILSMPRSLASFNHLPELVDALEPVLASSAEHSLEDLVGAMNRIRRLAKRGTDAALYHRQAVLMKKLSGLVLQRMDRIPGKLLSLAVNAVAEMRGNERWMEAAASRAKKVLQEGNGGLDMQAVAVILNGFARAGIRDEVLFGELAAEACRLAEEQPEAFGSQSVSVMVNAFAKMRIKDSALFERLAAVAMLIPAEEFSAQSVANILNAYAKNEEMHEPLMVYMSAVVRQLDHEQYQARHLSVSVNAFAKLNIRDEALLAYMQHAILARPPAAFDVQAIANILNGFGKLQGDSVDPALVAHMSAAIARTPAKHFDPTSLASILNALIKIEHLDEELWGRLAATAKKIDPLLFDAQAVSTIMHSFAKAELYDRALFERMAMTVGEMQFILEAQSIALILNACAKANYVNKQLVKHLSRVARQLSPESFSSQHVDNIVNSLARLGIRDRALFQHMAKVAQALDPAEFDAQAVAVTMNAFAKSMVRERVSQEIFAFFSSEVLPELTSEDLSPTSVSVILNAYAKTEIRDPEVVHMLCQNMLSGGPAGLDQFDARNIASVLHALATLYVEEPEIVNGLLARLVREDPAALEPEEVSIIAWSSAVLNVQDPRVIDWLLQGLAVHLPHMDDNFRRQAHQFVLSCELEGFERGVAELREKLMDHGTGSSVVTHSRLQKDVARVLAEMGLEFLEEYVDERSGYSVDVLMSDKLTAIEVDGPSHYARGTHTPLGNTLMKHRHLSHLGFDVRILPYWEWDELKSKEQKKEYLRHLLTSTPTLIYL